MGPEAYVTPPIIGGGGAYIGGGGGGYMTGGGAIIGGGYIAGGTIGAPIGHAGYTGATGATGTTGGTAPLMIAAAASVRRIVWSCEKKKPNHNSVNPSLAKKRVKEKNRREKKKPHENKEQSKTMISFRLDGT